MTMHSVACSLWEHMRARVPGVEVLSHALSQKAEHIPTASELAAHELEAEEAAS